MHDPLESIPKSSDTVAAKEYGLDSDIPELAVTTARARRLQGYNLYLRGLKKSEIASSLGVSQSLVTKWAKEDQWERRKVGISLKAEDILDQAVATEVAEAVKYFRSKLSERITELDMACKRGSVPAILAWLNRAGLNPKGETEDSKSTGEIKIVDNVSQKGVEKEIP